MLNEGKHLVRRQRYSPAEMVATDRRGIFGIPGRQLWTICTSHVEGSNLTVRMFMRRFVRLTVSFSKKLQNLIAAVNMQMAFCNFLLAPTRKGQERSQAAHSRDGGRSDRSAVEVR